MVEVVVVEVVRGVVEFEFGATLGALFGRGAFGAMLGALFGRLVGATLGALFGRDVELYDGLLLPLDIPPLLRPPPPLELPPLASATPDNTSAAHNTVSLKIFIYIFLVSKCLL